MSACACAMWWPGPRRKRSFFSRLRQSACRAHVRVCMHSCDAYLTRARRLSHIAAALPRFTIRNACMPSMWTQYERGWWWCLGMRAACVGPAAQHTTLSFYCSIIPSTSRGAFDLFTMYKSETTISKTILKPPKNSPAKSLLRLKRSTHLISHV